MIRLTYLLTFSLLLFACDSKESNDEKNNQQEPTKCEPAVNYTLPNVEEKSDTYTWKEEKSGGNTRKYKTTDALYYDNTTSGTSTPSKSQVQRATIASHRKLIKNGEIKFKTANIKKSKELISKTVQKLDGYISKENSSNYNGTQYSTMIIRVYSDKFEKLVHDVASKADNIEYKHIDINDVTEEYTDIEARIKAKKALEERYKELLKKAGKVSEMLEIEQQIGYLREEIESKEGRLNLLKDRISLSTLKVIFYHKDKVAPIVVEDEPNVIVRALSNGWNLIVSLTMAILTLWPLLILGFIGYRIYKKKTRKMIKE